MPDEALTPRRPGREPGPPTATIANMRLPIHMIEGITFAARAAGVTMAAWRKEAYRQRLIAMGWKENELGPAGTGENRRGPSRGPEPLEPR